MSARQDVGALNQLELVALCNLTLRCFGLKPTLSQTGHETGSGSWQLQRPWKGTRLSANYGSLWVPRTYEELARGLDAGMYESPRLDGKREVSRTRDVCKDVAAMANDGGVLLYGVDEGNDSRLMLGEPIDPHETEEVISNAVRTGIHNPPRIFPIPVMDPDGSDGFLVLVVPQSPLAPHMVDIGGEQRFFGRRGTQTTRLTGAQVEELFARRRHTEDEASAQLDAATTWVIKPTGVYSDSSETAVAATQVDYSTRSLTVLVAPTLPAGRVVDSARGDRSAAYYLEELWRNHRQEVGSEWLEVVEEAIRSWRVGVDSYLARFRNANDALGNTELQVGRAGSVALRHAAAVSDVGRGRLELHERMVANLTRWVLNCAGTLYRHAGYLGALTVGVQVDGLRDAVGGLMLDAQQRGRLVLTGLPAFTDNQYVRTTEILSLELPENSLQVVSDLLSDLFEAAADGKNYPPGFHPLGNFADFADP